MALTERLFPYISNEILKNKPGLKKRFKLLFQAKNPKELYEFHSKCDGKGPTVTLLYGKRNVVFGGYTSKDWFSGERMRKRDEDAFLFYMNDHDNASCNFFPIDGDYVHRAITCGTHLGPTFGGGFFFWQDWDLNTFDLSREVKPEMKDGFFTLNGSLNFNFAYKSQDRSFVNNDINGGTLCVKMLEVYQVEDEIWMSKPKKNEVQEQKKFLLNFETLRGSKIPKYNILLLGEIGCGKSSFYNTLVSAISGKVTHSAQEAANTTIGSVTNSIHAYDIISTDSNEVNVQMYDIRGFEAGRGFGTELKHLLKGELPKNYQFPETFGMFQELHKYDLKENPAMKDKIHLVCFVTDATMVNMKMSNYNLMKYDLIKIVHQLEIPLVCVVTKLDRLCPMIKENVENLFRSPVAFRTMKSISQSLGVLEIHVFPVVNYTNERVTSPTNDALAVQALYSMVRLIEDVWKDKAKDARDTWTERKLLSHDRSPQENISESTKQLQQKIQDNTRLNVVCVGPKGSGKSSFIDSINSAMTGSIGHKLAGAVCNDESDPVSSTKHFQLYAMLSYDKETNVRFGDMPGFQENGGIELEHVKMVINGHVPDKFKIQEGINQSDIPYIQTTNKETRIHCVCFVFDVSSVDSLTSSKTLEKCTGLIKWLSDRRIPFIVLITKSDMLSSAVHDNTLEIFENWLVRKNKNKLIKMLRIKESIVFPIRNYVHERRLVPEIDALLIEAIEEILKLGNDYLKDIDDVLSVCDDSN